MITNEVVILFVLLIALMVVIGMIAREWKRPDPVEPRPIYTYWARRK